MDIVYGGNAAYQFQSNIVFSNGLLDPWSAAGVFKTPINRSDSFPNTHGLYVQDLGRGSAAVLMEYGGHHTDLMYSNEADPPCVKSARSVEMRYIKEWIEEFWGYVP